MWILVCEIFHKVSRKIVNVSNSDIENNDAKYV